MKTLPPTGGTWPLWQRTCAGWRALPDWVKVLLQACAMLLLAMFVWDWFYARYRLTAITDPDAEDYAQIARQLRLGRGLTSRVMPLCGLEYLRLTGGDPAGGAVWPNLHRFPFMPLLEAGLFHIYGISDKALSVASGIFYIASVPMVYLLGRRFFGNWVGIVGAILYLFSPLSLHYSITGLTESASTFFMVTVLLLISLPRSRALLALAGILWGIAYWNRYTGAMLSVPFCIYLWAQDRKRASGNVAAFFLPMVIGMLPEMMRNYLLAGDPMFSLTAALMVPYKSAVAQSVHWWYVPVYVKPTAVLLAWPGAMFDKWTNEIYQGWRHLPSIVGPSALYPFLLLSLFLRAESAAQRRLRALTLVLVGMHVLTLPLLSNIVRYYAYLSPLLILFATWGLRVMAERMWPVLWPAATDGHPGPRLFGRTLPAAVALAVLGATMVVGWINAAGKPPRINLTSSLVDTWRSHMRIVRTMVGPEEVVLSNAPWSIAWRADRKSVPLPPGPSLVPMLARDYGLDIGGIFLTPRKIGSWETPNWRAWEEVRLGQRTVPGFRIAQRFHDGAILLVKDGKTSHERAIPRLLPEENTDS